MKRLVAIILISAISFSFCSCGKKPSGSWVRDRDSQEEYEETETEPEVERKISEITHIPNYSEFKDVMYTIKPDMGDLFISGNGETFNSACAMGFNGFDPVLEEYYSNEYAKTAFSSLYSSVETDVYDDIPVGDIYYQKNDNNGFIIFNISCDGTGEFFDGRTFSEQYFYGGIYYRDNLCLKVYIASRDPIKNSQMDSVDEVIKAFNLPTPR